MATANLDHHDLVNVTDNPGGPLVFEQVLNRIFKYDMYERPFANLCGRETTGNRYFEWIEDEYGAPSPQFAVDGADMTGNNATIGERKGNQCEILYREAQVSTRADVSNSIGRQGSMAYQIANEGQRIRRDQENSLMSDKASVVDDGNTTAGSSAGYFAIVATNTVFGATGADGGWNSTTKLFDAPTAGTAAALTEKDFKDVMQSIYVAGGNASVAMARPAIIRKMSEFYMSTNPAGAATQTNQRMGEERDRSNASYNAATVIITDFGNITTLRPNRLQPLSTFASPVADVSHLAIIDPQACSIAYLRGFTAEGLAKTGLSRHMMVTADYTLCVKEKICGAIRDIDETAAMVA